MSFMRGPSLTFLSTLTLSTALMVAQTPKPSASKQFLADAKTLTITNLDVLAADAFQRDRDNHSMTVDSILYKAKNDDPQLNMSREVFYEIVRRQKEMNDSMESQLDTFNTSKKFIGAFADAGGPIGVFAFTATDTYLDRFNGAIRSDLAKSKREEAEQFFAGRTLNIERLKNAQTSGPSAFVKEIETQSGMPDAFDDLLPEQRDAALLRLGEFTLSTVALEGEKAIATQSKNEKEFKRLRERISNIDKCQKQLASGMQDLMAQTETNTRQLYDLTKELDAQHHDLGLMQQVMMSHLTVDEQLKLVTDSKALDLSDNERQELIANLTKRKALIDNAQKWNDFVHTGNDVLRIADALGVDKDIVQNVQKGIAIGDTAYATINAALSGNYLGAIHAIAGLFGGGGVDAESAHYAAIMAKLDEIIETQRRIIAIQQAILKELGQIENLIIQNQIELRGALDNIFALQANTLDAVIQIKKADLNFCSNFIHRRYDDDGWVKDRGFRDYAAMREFFAENSPDYIHCVAALDQSIGGVTGTHGVFFGYPVLESEAAKTSDTHLVHVLQSYHSSVTPYIAYLKNFTPDISGSKRAIEGSFFAPSLDFDSLFLKARTIGFEGSGLDSQSPVERASSPQPKLSDGLTKLQTLRPISTFKYPDNDPAVQLFYTSFTSDLLSPDAVLLYADTETDINPYRELASPDATTLLDSNSLYNRPRNKSSQIALKSVFDWLSLAVAQQAFLCGDALLPLLAKDGFGDYTAPKMSLDQLMEKPSKSEEMPNQAAALAHYLLGHNPLMLQNAIRYRIFKQMLPENGDHRLTGFGYAWAYSHPEEPLLLPSLLVNKVAVEYAKKDLNSGVPADGWYSRYTFHDYTTQGTRDETLMVPLPPPEEVSAKAFVISTPLQRLLQCRSKVNDLLATNAMVQEVNGNPSAFRDLKVFLLMQHYQPPTGGTPVPTVSDDLRCKISVEDNNGR